MNLKVNKILVEGKVKSVIQAIEEDQVLIHYHDKVTAGNGEKEDYPEGKGKINNEISCIIFKELEKAGIKTHFIQYAGPALMRCKKVEIIPIEVVVRNIADGSIVRQTTIPKNVRFCPPLIEFYLKDDSKNDPLLTEDRMEIMGYRNVYRLKQYAKETNAVVSNLFSKIGITLVDFKIEFGRLSSNKKKIVLADEISPDSCRLWDSKSKTKLDKDVFRKGIGNLIDASEEVASRLGIVH